MGAASYSPRRAFPRLHVSVESYLPPPPDSTTLPEPRHHGRATGLIEWVGPGDPPARPARGCSPERAGPVTSIVSMRDLRRAADRIPQPDRPVLAPGGQGLAVGTEGH